MRSSAPGHLTSGFAAWHSRLGLDTQRRQITPQVARGLMERAANETDAEKALYQQEGLFLRT